MRILLATSNPHKVDEINAIWQSMESAPGKPDYELISLREVDDGMTSPIEDKPTFEGNAVLKAKYYAAATGMFCLADDSGLEVDVLSGDPGVHSARYARSPGPREIADQANNELLLHNLGDTPADLRAARFVCVMALCSPRAAEPLAVARGTIEGRIIGPGEKARGENGFGYDPLFYVPGLGKTTAELSPQHKNSISHRGAAARIMWDKMQGFEDAG